ncbi:MAG: YebC/PmpR family DNA-binding transcriptional regulator [Christensenellales bacterium]|uniref:Probable transcriptional regulatory protein IAA66_10680 n=1 Tax=Candidatus Avichristensenella intestinipullorum TaxID=2840693 RepID=A0A9D1CJC4_9FIRM|nr:YebC/PmpR family DNA-binding transcriptional regulator [Christensenellales bacterium]HIQ64026.1 YebC/PmpR family DNA-binding transcriptional regulator [Candidatus Avichristensenella intestinipullorum]
MSGHSKWANIKHKKGKADAARGKIFTKIGREIAIAVREGGSDPETNGKLRDVVAKAKANNMPNDNILRSIKKAAGELGSVNYEEITYEGYSAGGMAVLVECVTDNRNRTASDIRHYFDKFGGNLGATGSVGWMFDRKGLIVVDRKPGMDEDEVMMAALEAGASDVQTLDDAFEIYTEVGDFSAVREALEKERMSFLSAELTRIPQNTVDIGDAEVLEKIEKLLEALDDMDDVQNVYHNGNLPEDEEEDE